MLAKWENESELSEELIVVQLGVCVCVCVCVCVVGVLGKNRKEVKGRCV